MTTPVYWWVCKRQYEQSPDSFFHAEPADYCVQGAGGEKVYIEGGRMQPHEELEVIARALNALPAYHEGSRV